ncbi:MAG: hypothetical protein ACLGRW_11175 [Acidobacteriota bacterium]|jgi:hypothetical protein
MAGLRLSLRIFFLMLCSVALLASPVIARGADNDAFFGYSRLGSDAFYPNVGGLNGWEAALHIHLAPFVGVEGDVAQYGIGANSTIPRTTTVLFGPRVTVGLAGFHVFAHGLVGIAHSANSAGPPISDTNFADAIGGGLDVPILPFFAWRFAGDYLDAPSQSPPGGTHARFSTGLVFRF